MSGQPRTDHDEMCDRCLRTRRRSQLRKVKGERVTVLVCKDGCGFQR